MRYKVIKEHRSYCTKALDDEFFAFYTRDLTGQTAQKPEDKRSIGVVNALAGEMMGKVYVATMFPPEAKIEMLEMVNETLEVMKKSIGVSTWLTPDTKEKALQKLSKFKVKIGYPDKWKDYSAFDVVGGDSLYTIAKKAHAWHQKTEFEAKLNSVLDRTEWRMTPQTVNAYFMPTQNEICFPAAIIQPPFFNRHETSIDFDFGAERSLAPKADFRAAANFGAIGAVIAHEITHGYDDQGRQFDGDGNLQEWWTHADDTLFREQSKLMTKQAERYIFCDNGKEHRQNPGLTLGENLADLGGLSLSLKALKIRLDSQNATPEEVKASLRIAFKAWANVWKTNMKSERRVALLATDPHAPCDFRGNIVKNMAEFHDVFEVVKGDGMWLPENERLRMW